jgi:hypothetical protein
VVTLDAPSSRFRFCGAGLLDFVSVTYLWSHVIVLLSVFLLRFFFVLELGAP